MCVCVCVFGGFWGSALSATGTASLLCFFVQYFACCRSENHEDHRAPQHGESSPAKCSLHVLTVAWNSAGPQQHPSHHLLQSHLLWRSSVHDTDTERAPFWARHSPLPRASFGSCLRQCRAGIATMDRCAITQPVPARYHGTCGRSAGSGST